MSQTSSNPKWVAFHSVVLGAALLLLPATGYLQASAGKGNALRREMLVSTRWLDIRIGTADLVVVHVGGEVEDYKKGHIPTARFLPISDIAVTRNGIPNELPPLAELTETARRLGIRSTSRIVLYDQGMGMDAARAYVAMEYLGLGDRTSLLDGHWKKWSAEGKRISQADPVDRTGGFWPRPETEVLIHLDALEDLVWAAGREEGGISLIDTRPRAQYVGEIPGPGVGRPGHIPGAHNVFWADNVESAENPVLKGLSGLQDLYRPAGIRPGDRVVVYCRTGRQASFGYFVLRYLGYDARLYDASYIEWQARTETPVMKGDSVR